MEREMSSPIEGRDVSREWFKAVNEFIWKYGIDWNWTTDGNRLQQKVTHLFILSRFLPRFFSMRMPLVSHVNDTSHMYKSDWFPSHFTLKMLSRIVISLVLLTLSVHAVKQCMLYRSVITQFPPDSLPYSVMDWRRKWETARRNPVSHLFIYSFYRFA